MRKIAVLGADKNLLGFYHQAKDLGYYIIGIAWPEGAVCKDLCDKFYPISFADRDDVLRVCKEEKVDGITSFTLESALPTLVYVAQKLGLVANSIDCVERTRTKFCQRESLRAAGIPTCNYQLVKVGEALDMTIDWHFPLIVKPVDSGGSKGVHIVHNIEEIPFALKKSTSFSRSGMSIVEEYIDGREFSVEYLSCNGKHYFCQLTDKVTSGAPLFVELQHHQPANVTDEQLQQIKDYVEISLTALGIENSPSHTEIKLNSRNELHIIETGARLGGDKITEHLVKLSTGIDMVAESLKLACGDFSGVVSNNIAHAGVYFYSKLAPEVKSFINQKDTHPEFVMTAISKDTLDEVHSNADRNGFLIYQSDRRIELR